MPFLYIRFVHTVHTVVKTQMSGFKPILKKKVFLIHIIDHVSSDVKEPKSIQINPNPTQNISQFTFNIEVRCIPGTHGTGLLWFVCISISLYILFLIFSDQFHSKMNYKKKYFYSRIFFFQKYSLKMKFFLKWFSTSKRWMVLDCSRLLQLPSSPPGRVISTPPEMTVARCHHGNILDLKLGLVLDNARERVPP